jgi:hypothetical protein
MRFIIWILLLCAGLHGNTQMLLNPYLHTSAPSFVPSDIAGLSLWSRADQISASDGDAIDTWTDLSGNGNHSTQSDATKKPTYKTNIINGKPVLRFDALDDAMDNNLIISNPYTIFIVEYFSTNTANSRTINSITVNALISGGRSGNNSVYVDGNVSDYYTTAPAKVMLNLQTGATNMVYRVNGIDRTSSSLSSRDFGHLHLGTDVVYAEPAACDIAEIIVYNSSLSDANRTLVQTYLNNKYAIY